MTAKTKAERCYDRMRYWDKELTKAIQQGIQGEILTQIKYELQISTESFKAYDMQA